MMFSFCRDRKWLLSQWPVAFPLPRGVSGIIQMIDHCYGFIRDINLPGTFGLQSLILSVASEQENRQTMI